MQSKNIIYALACLSFSIICGAATYEHLVVWPNAFAKIPASLTMFQGEHALNSATFWPMIHPVTLLLMAVALVLCWKTPRRKHLLYTLAIYAVVLTTTFIYFVPELLELIRTPYSNTVDEGLTSRGSRWETLSLVRGVVLFATAIFLYLGLTKPVERTRTAA